jgi:CheY-like chemotaxis protein
MLTTGTTWSQRMLSKTCTGDDLFTAIQEVVNARDRDRSLLDATLPAKVAQKPVILHIESNLHDAAIFRKAVEAFTSDIDLRQVADGKSGLTYLARRGEFALAPMPHLILIDVDIPSMNGYEFLARYRAAANAITTVVGLTSTPDSRKNDEAILHGAASILAKPTTWDRYLELARKIVIEAAQSALSAPR